MSQVNVGASQAEPQFEPVKIFSAEITKRRRVSPLGMVRRDDHGHDQHSANVAWLTARMCEVLDIPASQAVPIVSGARSHDLGKARVPRELLERIGPLGPKERELVNLHPLHGASLLLKQATQQNVDLTVEISVALLHHERWAGGGYPLGLIGTEIPLAARIVAAADVFDALVSTRPYKAAWPQDKAIQFIREARGTQFDPECADALITVSGRLPFHWMSSARLWQLAVVSQHVVPAEF